MAPIPPGAFADALRDLDGDEFAALVADLWTGCGWDVERDGQLVRVARRGESRDLLVLPPRRLARYRRAPTIDDSIDAVVTANAAPSRAALPRGLPADVDVIDAGDLRERALYALDADDAEAVADRYLGVPLSDSRWSTSGGEESGGVLPVPARASSFADAFEPLDPLDGSRSTVALAVVALVVLAAIVAVGGPATLLQAAGDAPSPGPNGTAASGGPDGGDASTGGGNASGTTRDDDAGTDSSETTGDDESEAVAPLPPDLRNLTDPENDPNDGSGANATWSDLYQSEPNCERGSRSVARLLSAGFTGPHPDRSLELYWRFTNPDLQASTDYSSFVGTHRAAYQRVFRADRIDLGEQRRLAESPPQVVIHATVRWDDDTQPYEFELQRWASGDEDGCWVVDRFSPPLD